jgi:hypothetical protein
MSHTQSIVAGVGTRGHCCRAVASRQAVTSTKFNFGIAARTAHTAFRAPT